MDNIFQPTQKFFYSHNPMALLSQTPTINTWYAILAATDDVKLDEIAITQSNDEAAAKNLQLRIVVDGETIALSDTSVPNAATRFVSLTVSPTDHTLALVTGQGSIIGFPLYGLSLAIDMRITSATGTNQLIKGGAHYQTLEVT